MGKRARKAAGPIPDEALAGCLSRRPILGFGLKADRARWLPLATTKRQGALLIVFRLTMIYYISLELDEATLRVVALSLALLPIVKGAVVGVLWAAAKPADGLDRRQGEAASSSVAPQQGSSLDIQ
jgi:hypothetical protein